MKSYNIKLNFQWDDGVDTREAIITIPDGITPVEVVDKLEESHKYLCFEDDEDIYGIQGRNPDTLLNYVCKNNPEWGWTYFQFNIEVDFD